MISHLDRFGRLVIPKLIRDRLRLQAGSAVELREHPDGVDLIALDGADPLEERDGVLVYRGAAAGDLRAVTGAVREERIDRLAGARPR